MKKPTGKLKFAYQTIANLEAKIEENEKIIKEVYEYHLKQTETNVTPELATVVSVLYGIMEKLKA